MDPISPTPISTQTRFPLEALDPGEGPCQQCGESPSRTNEYMWVASFLVLTRHATYQARLCRRCATHVGLKELGKSAAFGWWGFPWGLLTFQALGKNFLSLWRWSRIPKALVAGLFLLGLAAPVGLVVYMLRDQERTEAARHTGDLASEEVVALVNKGHKLFDDGKLPEALQAYQEAHQKAPGSSAINSSLAVTYAELGRFSEALPYAARASELAPEEAGKVALHGWLLGQIGDWEGARAKAKALIGRTPKDEGAEQWVCNLFYALEDWGALDKATRDAAAKYPQSSFFSPVRLFALVAQDDLAGYVTLRDGLSKEMRENHTAKLAEAVHTMRTRPAEQMPAFLAAWAAGEYSEVVMRQFVQAATRADYLEDARRQVRTWLFASATPGDAWFLAGAWLPQEELPGQLDRYLAARSEPAPLMLRMRLLDPLRDSALRLELARRGREASHPLAPTFDSIYIQEARRHSTITDWLAEMRRHLAAHPEHHGCRLALADALLDEDPVGARALFEGADVVVPPDLAPSVALLQAESLLAEDKLVDAARILTKVEQSSPDLADGGSLAHILRMEIALRVGDDEELRRHADAIAKEESELRAAALVLQWSAELASGRPVTYRSDVDAWLANLDVEGLRSSFSRSTQALLLLEGRTDAETVRLAVGPSASPTLPWVTLLRQAAETGVLDEAALRHVADAKEHYAWAARTARIVGERRAKATATRPPASAT